MSVNLSLLAIVLGLGVALPQVFGLANPQNFADRVRKFPRNVPVGIALMLLATAWFEYNVSIESISDFGTFKPWLMGIFAAVGIGTCIFVQDFIAVRGLAVVFLLLAKLMLDTGRPHLPGPGNPAGTPWVLVIQAWAYLLVVLGMWLTISPWRLREFLNWMTANETRIRVGSAARLAFGLFIAALGVLKFR